jgi:hypothetical protein
MYLGGVPNCCMMMSMQEVSAKTGVPRNSIVPIKNYCTEFEPTALPGILILRGVYEALSAATDYLREYSDLSGLTGEFKKLKVCHKRHTRVLVYLYESPRRHGCACIYIYGPYMHIWPVVQVLLYT